MSDKDKEKIEEIMAGITCSHGFKCTEEGNENLCKTRTDEIAGRKELFCEDYTNQTACKFAAPFGGGAKPYGYFCKCPLQLYLSEKLKKLDMG